MKTGLKVDADLADLRCKSQAIRRQISKLRNTFTRVRSPLNRRARIGRIPRASTRSMGSIQALPSADRPR